MIRWPSRCCAHRGCRAHGLAAVHGGDRSTFGFLIRGAHATRVPVWRLAQANFESRRKKSRKMNQERRKRGFDFRSTLNHQLSTFFSGGIAQLVERQLCKLEVRGSNPLASSLFSDSAIQ